MVISHSYVSLPEGISMGWFSGEYFAGLPSDHFSDGEIVELHF